MRDDDFAHDDDVLSRVRRIPDDGCRYLVDAGIDDGLGERKGGGLEVSDEDHSRSAEGKGSGRNNVLHHG